MSMVEEWWSCVVGPVVGPTSPMLKRWVDGGRWLAGLGQAVTGSSMLVCGWEASGKGCSTSVKYRRPFWSGSVPSPLWGRLEDHWDGQWPLLGGAGGKRTSIVDTIVTLALWQVLDLLNKTLLVYSLVFR